MESTTIRTNAALPFRGDGPGRSRAELPAAELRRQQAGALGWSAAQADAMLWADRGWLHFDGRRFYKKNPDDRRGGRGRTVAKARVEALASAGFLTVNGEFVGLTRDGHDARRAWIASAPDPAEQEPRTLRPLLFGEEEARRDAALAAARAEREKRDAGRRRFLPEPAAPAVVVEPDVCEHERYAWLCLTADRITGRLGYHLACACGQETKAYPGNSPAMNTGTASRPLGIRDADTQTAVYHADRCGYAVTGRWVVLDERTKRAAVEPADEPMWPVVTDPGRTRNELAAPAVGQDQDQDQDQAQDEEEATAAVDPDEAQAAWIDRQADRSGRLPVDGPGIIGPGTHITWRPGHGPGMRSKHASAGTVVRIRATAVTWRPYGAARTLRTPLTDMRVAVPRTGAAVAGTGHTAGWRRWSLADHLAYARRTCSTQAAETAPADARPAAAAVQLPLWPAPVASCPEPAGAAGIPAAAPPAVPAGPVVVIPCSGAKLDRPAPAGELYRGPLHTMCRRAADALTADGGTVLVLSARWGLVPLDRVIAPYDLRMGDPGSVTTAQLRTQAAALGVDSAADVTVLAGAAYTTAARSVWPQATAPLAGSRGIGEMRHRLAQLARTSHRQTA